jgi:hypothetical protein
MRMNSTVRAGRVVAEVAVLCVDRKSVRRKKGSSKMLQREVKSFRLSTISSKLLWCLMLVSDSTRLCAFCPFSPVHPVDDSGEYLRVYMPSIRPETTMMGPAYLVTASPYRTTAQKVATRRKLSHGSPVVHVTRPANLFRGSMKGCEYASTRVICGGVAASSGDFWCTSIADRSFVCGVVWPKLAGEKDAYVGFWGSPAGCGDDASLLDLEEVDMCTIQGVSRWISACCRRNWVSTNVVAGLEVTNLVLPCMEMCVIAWLRRRG